MTAIVTKSFYWRLSYQERRVVRNTSFSIGAYRTKSVRCSQQHMGILLAPFVPSAFCVVNSRLPPGLPPHYTASDKLLMGTYSF